MQYRTKAIMREDQNLNDDDSQTDKSQEPDVFQTYDDADVDDDRPKHLRFAEPEEEEKEVFPN